MARLAFFAVVSGFCLTSLAWWAWAHRRTRGRQRLLVSNGVGNWYPLRIQAPAAIVQLILRPAKS